MKRLLDVVDVFSDGCPLHGKRRERIQQPELDLYECCCEWDQATAAQLKAAP